MLPEAVVRLIAGFGRSAAKAPSTESILMELFHTLQVTGNVGSIRVIHPFDHSMWTEWVVSDRGASVKRRDERPDPAGKDLTALFDPENEDSGYVSVKSSSQRKRNAKNGDLGLILEA